MSDEEDKEPGSASEAVKDLNDLFAEGFTVPPELRMNSIYGKMGVQPEDEAAKAKKAAMMVSFLGYFLVKRLRRHMRVI